jgi:hypothetical protein
MSRLINTDCEADCTARKVNKKTASKSTGTYGKNREPPNTDNITTGKKVSINQYKMSMCKCRLARNCTNKIHCKYSGTGNKCAKHDQDKINARFSGSGLNINKFKYHVRSSLSLIMFIVITFLMRRNTDEAEVATDLAPVQAFSTLTRLYILDLFNSQVPEPAQDPATPVDTKMLHLSFRTENKKNISSSYLNGLIYNFRILTRILQSYWISELADLLPDPTKWVRISISCENLRMCTRSRRG